MPVRARGDNGARSGGTGFLSTLTMGKMISKGGASVERAARIIKIRALIKSAREN